jgi:hypothetical protein
MKKFINRVKQIYQPGAEFNIVIDNVCAVFVNDIKTSETERYCSRFRELIREFNVEREIKLLVESEHFNETDYHVKPLQEDDIKSYKLTEEAYENVERFLGHTCPREDAIRRILIYKQIGDRTDELFSNYFENAIHMTQRASKTTIGFRPFPGRDSRIQSGRVVLGINKNKKNYPFLLTSTTYEKFTYENYTVPEKQIKSIKEITFARPI